MTKEKNVESIFYFSKKKVGKEIKKVSVDIFTVIDKKDIWEAERGVKVIGKTGQEKIAEKEGIVVKDFQVVIQPNEENKQQHGVLIWLGYKGDDDKDNWSMATGEASKLNTGEIINSPKGKKYVEHTKIDSKYRLAMAEKRAYGRALNKLIGLVGVYGEYEAEEFKNKKVGEQNLDY